jgi:DNA helicase-2/ATP-dependent DNA helicase PcrA
MKLVADLHIHSHFSRATSPNLTFEHLARWAQLKGIQIVGTGDIAHPGWLAEMREKLAPAEDGLFRLRDDLAAAVEADVPPVCRGPVRFIIGGEISNIYKRDGQTRKVHNVVFAPSFDAVEKLQARLERIGNIRADGRPILGLDSRDLLELVLATDPGCHLIPAHIWTPWFSLLGSKSGFDSVEECFADLTPHIFALETGLSSDPPMNWRVSALDRYTLVSNSDAHSPEKLGREANLFDGELAYGALFGVLKAQTRMVSENPSGLSATVEFFPEEGKYHFDGHRACNVVWDPPATRAHRDICPVCGKPVTVGVMHRVEALADRPAGVRPAHAAPFVSLIPLPEVLGEVYSVGPGSKQVGAEYTKLLARLGPELAILRETPLEEITAAGGERLAEAIGRMRRGEVVAQPGYDGEYGVIRVFGGAGVSETQIGLFGDKDEGRKTKDEGLRSGGRSQAPGGRGQETGVSEQLLDLFTLAETPAAYASANVARSADHTPRITDHEAHITSSLNAEQRAAVLCTDAALAIIAGPGTGKTRTLTARIAHLIQAQGVAPEAVLAITFTNKAAGEMRERLEGLLGGEAAGRVTIKTFHAFGAMLLRQYADRLGLSPQFVILSEEDRLALLRQACPELKASEVEAARAEIAAAKAAAVAAKPRLKSGADSPNPLKRIDEGADQPASAGLAYQAAVETADRHARYTAALRAADAVDFDDLILLPVRLLEEHPDVLAALRARYRWISVDEYQDVNAAQYRLLRLLAGEEETRKQGDKGDGVNLCVIGDPDQAIYGFRGADPRYFLRFEQDYPGARVLSLSRNYRSSRAILDAATQVIARNPDRKSVQILAEFADEVRLDVYRAPTDKAEAEYVVHQIEQLVGGTSYFSLDSGRTDGATPAAARSFADFAVLYRLSAQSRLLIEAFDRSGIPYQTVGQTSLYETKAVREVLAHLWRLYNPRAPLLAAQVANLRHLEAGQPVARLIEQVIERLAEQRKKPVSDADAERLRQLALRGVPFGERLGDFLEMTALQSETDVYDPRADRVTLMSLHASKGLEFPVVFIVGCEEGLLPYERKGEPVDVAEERRLFYVGLTRAGRKLVLTHARKRVLFGQFTENAPSRFVGDIEAALKEIQARQYRPPERKPESGQMSLF